MSDRVERFPPFLVGEKELGQELQPEIPPVRDGRRDPVREGGFAARGEVQDFARRQGILRLGDTRHQSMLLKTRDERVEVPLFDVPDEAERFCLRERLVDLVRVHRALAEEAEQRIFHCQGSALVMGM